MNMKSHFITLAFALLAIVSCAKTVEQPELEGAQISIRAYQEGATESRTTVQNGGTQMYWEPGYGSHLSSTNTELTREATFTGSVNASIDIDKGLSEGNSLLGLYPYSSDATSDGVSVTTVLPENQIGRCGSFARNTHISLACTDSHSMFFYSVCGGLRFSLTHYGITEIRFEGFNSETIAGRIKLAFEDGVPCVQEVLDNKTVITLTAPNGGSFDTDEWYYIEILPGLLENGFRIEFLKESERASSVFSKPVTIKRGVFGSIGNIDDNVEFTSNHIDVQYYGCQVFSDHTDIDIYAMNMIEYVYGFGIDNLKKNWASAVAIFNGDTYDLPATDGYCKEEDWQNEYGDYSFIWAFSNPTIRQALLDASPEMPVTIIMTDVYGNEYIFTYTEPQNGYYSHYKYGAQTEPSNVNGISLNKTELTLRVGETASLKASVTPSNALDKSIEWSSSDPPVATVDSDGKVTGVKAGTTTITATTVDGGYTAKCEVTVVEPVIVIDGDIVIDRDFSDWAALKGGTYSECYGDEDSLYPALTAVKVYATPLKIFVYFEYDSSFINPLPDIDHVPFHCFINTDGNAATGGWGDEFSDACTDVMLEGFIYPDGVLGSYDPSACQWAGEPNSSGWCWGDWENRLFPDGGLCTGAGVEGKYELSIDCVKLASAGFPIADEFSIGFDIQQNWNSVGILPSTAPSEDNPSGILPSLKVKVQK